MDDRSWRSGTEKVINAAFRKHWQATLDELNVSQGSESSTAVFLTHIAYIGTDKTLLDE